jgi:2-succinyl-5-enolpyruvyl-6-hydroxy-3-cyclohexene-1-carboxylate synthase
MKNAAPNINYLWAELVIEELARCGVTFIAIAPGSRSSPLAVAAARNRKVKSVVHVDERGLAYLALGWARARGRAAAVITTSGTAVANLAPAIAESSHDHIPLIALTADRPPELRETGANQTMRQAGAFATWVRWQFDLPVPTDEIPARMVLTTVDQAVAQAQRAPAGPVHLNMMFREPLAPVPRRYDTRVAGVGLDRWRRSREPFTRCPVSRATASGAVVREVMVLAEACRRGVVVAGAMDAAAAGAAAELAARLGWPLVPDVRSGLRLGMDRGSVIPHADLALAAPRFRASHSCDLVLHLGGRLVSRRLNEYTQAEGLRYVHVTESGERLDPAHRVGMRVEGDVAAFCRQAVRVAGRRGGGRGWLQSWRRASRLAGAALAGAQTGKMLDEPGLAWELSTAIGPGAALFLGSSLPIRMTEAFASARGAAVPVAANRGVSGIDGVLASAAGYARGASRPVTLLIGDLSLLHDLNSLALLRRAEQPVTVVVVNNDGGGIFSFLPVAGTVPEFERIFGTPHGMNFESAASMFGLPYARVADRASFRRCYREHQAAGRSSILEVTTKRSETVVAFRRLQARVARALALRRA